jgi:hypothetical protein
MELSKADKKVARSIIEKGLQKEFENGLNEFYQLLRDWKDNQAGNRDVYHNLYGRVREFDKHIVWRYDRMSGKDYIFIITNQLIEGHINDQDLTLLSVEARGMIDKIMKLR